MAQTLDTHYMQGIQRYDHTFAVNDSNRTWGDQNRLGVSNRILASVGGANSEGPKTTARDADPKMIQIHAYRL